MGPCWHGPALGGSHDSGGDGHDSSGGHMGATSKPKRRRGRNATTRVSPDRILVASAGDPESAGALRLTAAIAASGDPQVLALAVAPPFPSTVAALVTMRHAISVDEQQRRAVLQDLRRSVEKLPGSAAWAKRAVVGMPADAIIEVASQWKATMIVLGIGRH